MYLPQHMGPTEGGVPFGGGVPLGGVPLGGVPLEGVPLGGGAMAGGVAITGGAIGSEGGGWYGHPAPTAYTDLSGRLRMYQGAVPDRGYFAMR